MPYICSFQAVAGMKNALHSIQLLVISPLLELCNINHCALGESKIIGTKPSRSERARGSVVKLY